MSPKTLLSFVIAVATAVPAFAQCPGGVCPTSFGSVRYSARVRTYQQSTFNGALTRVPATTRFIPYVGRAEAPTPAPCASVGECSETAIEPCAPVETSTVEPCAPVESSTPCEPFAPGSITCEETSSIPAPCEPVETSTACETCDPITPQFQSYRPAVNQECASNSCPLRTATRAVANTAATATRTAVKLASAPLHALLDRANATRASYGLPAFTYDETLEVGALNQAAYCSKVGTLVHGGGCAEILAQNSQGIETALNQWLQSPQHRAMLLNGCYRYAGVAVVRDGYGRSWCAMRFR